jgi:hypothetical protein
MAARLDLRGTTTRCNVMSAENLKLVWDGFSRTLLNSRSVCSEPDISVIVHTTGSP